MVLDEVHEVEMVGGYLAELTLRERNEWSEFIDKHPEKVRLREIKRDVMRIEHRSNPDDADRLVELAAEFDSVNFSLFGIAKQWCESLPKRTEVRINRGDFDRLRLSPEFMAAAELESKSPITAGNAAAFGKTSIAEMRGLARLSKLIPDSYTVSLLLTSKGAELKVYDESDAMVAVLPYGDGETAGGAVSRAIEIAQQTDAYHSGARGDCPIQYFPATKPRKFGIVAVVRSDRTARQLLEGKEFDDRDAADRFAKSQTAESAKFDFEVMEFERRGDQS